MFSIAVLPHSPGVVYYHLLLRRETRIPGVAPFSFRIGIWDLFVYRGQNSYTPTAFWDIVDHSRSKMQSYGSLVLQGVRICAGTGLFCHHGLFSGAESPVGVVHK